uniref:Fucolectin tachylectin-4 pentraxin-1 domain-containing protein n=1 Tax=Sinocyclocheilus rhinocerous TaxID=307959 RepID=A0A673GWR1_9TELE
FIRIPLITWLFTKHIITWSSTYSDLGAAQNAVDGNRQSSYALGSCSVTNGDMNSWWRVDLLDVYRVTRVSITNRGDCCEKTVEGIQIRIGNSLENNGNNNELAAIVGPIPLGNTKTFEFKHVMGRYVNLIVPGRNEYLTLCEVEVYSGNLALNARVVQSSLGHSQGDAEHAVDGNRDANYGKGSCTHTKAEFNPWWRADLGNVAITNRVDCCKERLRGAQIRIGNKLENNGNNNELAATVLTVPDGTVVLEFEPVNGRYVNIFLPGNDEIITLCEVEVFADR